jgi:dethiobiotin synthetase
VRCSVPAGRALAATADTFNRVGQTDAAPLPRRAVQEAVATADGWPNLGSPLTSAGPQPSPTTSSAPTAGGDSDPHAESRIPDGTRMKTLNVTTSDAAARLGTRRAADVGRRRWIILGTGTGIGKTFAARGLVSLLARDGVPVAGLKPIETGLSDGETGDAALLAEASFAVPLPPTHPLYAFDDPVTPARAARAAARRIDLQRIVTWTRDVESDAPTGVRLVIETAGGVFSPLDDGVTNFDLARALDPALWVLIAPDRLGVLHDVGSCLLAMEALGRRPDYVVLSAPEHADSSTGTNREELARNPRMPPLIDLPRNNPSSLRRLLTLSAEPSGSF